MRELLDRIREAHVAIRPQVPVTPLECSHALSAEFGADVWLKCEHHQPTGSFKLRGATNKMRLLAEAGETRGIITASTGNHGQAAARAGRLAGIPVRVYVAASTVPSKLEAIRALGAELVLVEGPPILAETSAREAAAAEGLVYVSPYNDLDVVAGQGTLGMELFDQAPDLDAVFIAVGGGGLIGGTGTALKALRPELRVVGCWPENSACMLRAIEAGGIVDVAEGPTLSDGTAGAIEAGSVTYPICEAVIDDMVTVDEAAIADAMARIARSERWIVEGAAGVALAGFIAAADRYRGAKVAIVLCGRNIGVETFLSAIAGR